MRFHHNSRKSAKNCKKSNTAKSPKGCKKPSDSDTMLIHSVLTRAKIADADDHTKKQNNVLKLIPLASPTKEGFNRTELKAKERISRSHQNVIIEVSEALKTSKTLFGIP